MLHNAAIVQLSSWEPPSSEPVDPHHGKFVATRRTDAGASSAADSHIHWFEQAGKLSYANQSRDINTNDNEP